MEHKRDIGELFQQKLEAGTQAPKETLWNRLDASLETQARKRRRALWFWSTGAGLVVIALLSTIWVTTQPNELNPIEEHASTTEPVAPDGTPATETNATVEHTDLPQTVVTTIPKTKPVSHTSATETANRVAPENEKTERGTKATGADTLTEKGFQKTTTHQYYNSDMGGTISGTKQQIDSIVRANERAMAETDAIMRARAADSVKLNERSRDSIR